MNQTTTAPASIMSAFPADRPVAIVASLGLVFGAAFLLYAFDTRHAALYLIGGALGAVLYHAAFGFTGTWRAFILHRHARALRAQLVMIALATVFFLPLIDAGAPFGRQLVGAVGPVGLSVTVGAFLFGVGMQFGGGCGSGTLFTVGGGNQRMLVTLLFFIFGSVLGTLHLPWWLTLPSFGPLALAKEFSLPLAITLQLTLLGCLGILVTVLERRRHGCLSAAPTPTTSLTTRLLKGPWPIIWGAIALAVLNVATLLIAGHSWSITFAFGLWGAKALSALGVDVASWAFWTWPYPAKALAGSVLADITSVMNFGLVFGAMLAAAIVGKFAAATPLPARSVLAAVIGGILMGYGARLAFGCNIGALFSGIASGSVHGWLWLVAAFIGSMIGTWIRPAFRLSNTATTQSCS